MILSVSRYASYRRGAFLKMIFTTRVNSYIGTTIVVPDTMQSAADSMQALSYWL